MGDRPFSKPVFLTLNETGNFQASSAWEALEYLVRYWPGDRGPHYRRARQLCEEAVDGFIDAERARTALIEAARRAKVLEPGWKPGRDTSKVVYRALREQGSREVMPG